MQQRRPGAAKRMNEKKKHLENKDRLSWDAKWLSGEALQIAVKRREAKSKGEKERYPFECRVPKNSKER